MLESLLQHSVFASSGRIFATAIRLVIILLAAKLLPCLTFADAVTNVTTYTVKGVFKESRSAGREAVITHETIPGYMNAMTMPFDVKKPAELGGLQPGDKIAFRLSVTKTDAWIDEIKKTGEPALNSSPAHPLRQSIVPELQPGALIPDCILTNQLEQRVHISDFKGQALAFTFFFSRCPLPTYCPRMNSNLAAVQEALLTDTAKTNWQLLSISFDPEFDTPAHLAEHAKFYQSNLGHWNFATSSPEEIIKLGGEFGLMFWHENGTISHNLRTVVVDASGRVQKVFTDNEWQPAQLVAEIKKAMEVTP
jgi:protein SCO1/2